MLQLTKILKEKGFELQETNPYSFIGHKTDRTWKKDSIIIARNRMRNGNSVVEIQNGRSLKSFILPGHENSVREYIESL